MNRALINGLLFRQKPAIALGNPLATVLGREYRVVCPINLTQEKIVRRKAQLEHSLSQGPEVLEHGLQCLPNRFSLLACNVGRVHEQLYSGFFDRGKRARGRQEFLKK